MYRLMTRCPLCGKKSRMVTRRILLRGHYNPTVKKRKYPNLQWANVEGSLMTKLAHGRKRMKICTDCKKKLNKTRK